MPETHEPILAYNRIDANKRKTRLLLASFVLVFFPFMSGAAVYVSPWLFMFGVASFQMYGSPEQHARMDGLLAEVEKTRGADGALNLSEVPTAALVLEFGFIAVALVLVIAAVSAVTILLISRYASQALLRAARARRIEPAQEPELVRRVENLCIGAGLPVPSLYLIDSGTPNAFAIGRDPEHASLVVTRGLLALLDERQLDGVIAHELSHIGNQDIRLSTVLAGMVGTLTIPFRMFAFFFRPFRGLHLGLKLAFALFAFPLCFSLVAFYADGIFELLSPQFEFPGFLRWWGLHAMLAPPYVLFVAPAVALMIRQAVSREREFLADADAAVLTRDPEGLALALVKVATAGGARLRVGEASVHLYFSDPMAGMGSIMHWLFPSHPPVERRIELLARMGSGITPADLQRAREAGARVAQMAAKQASEARLAAQSERQQAEDIDTQRDNRAHGEKTSHETPAPSALTPLYEQADGWSHVIARLPPDASVKPLGRQGEFVRVLTANNVTGYVSRAARLNAVQAFEEAGSS